MKVYFVGAGPGDPELLTIRAERLLRNAAVCIYAGSLVSPAVVALLPPSAEKHDSARLSLAQTTGLCVSARDRGLDVVRLHSGDPSIYGAIREQMDELDAAGIEYAVVPGVSSFQAAAAALRAELTAPEVAQTIILTRTADRTPVPPEQELALLARTQATLCIFLSIHKLDVIAGTLAAHYGSDAGTCPGLRTRSKRTPSPFIELASHSGPPLKCRTIAQQQTLIANPRRKTLTAIHRLTGVLLTVVR